MKEIQTYIKQLFQSGQNELQTRDVDKENKENDRPGISTCSSHVFTNPETKTFPENWDSKAPSAGSLGLFRDYSLNYIFFRNKTFLLEDRKLKLSASF